MSVRLISGDCREMLQTLPDSSVQCCVTSPPYFGLRRYLDDCDQDKHLEIGTEPTPDEYVATLVGVFREVWRVLRDDGTVWLNLGDTVRNKQVQFIPHRVAMALQANGWVCRSQIVWHKPSVLPESCTDRPTNSYEMVFLLAKSGDSTYWTHRNLVGTRIQPAPDYRYIHRATGEERIDDPCDKKNWRRVNLWSGHDYFYDEAAIAESATGLSGGVSVKHFDARLEAGGGGDSGLRMGWPGSATRNARNVWAIASTSFAGQHYATFPPELPERCIKAGTSEAGACPHCGAPWERIVEKGEPDREHQVACGGSASDGGYNGTASKNYGAAGVQNASDVKRRILEGMRTKRTTGWRPTCSCPEHAPVPCLVLDCFAGSGTTGMVADRLGRDSVLIELKQDGLAQERITQDCPLFAEVVA